MTKSKKLICNFLDYRNKTTGANPMSTNSVLMRVRPTLESRTNDSNRLLILNIFWVEF